MLLMLSVRLAAAIHYYLRAYAPTNILLRRLHSRDGLKWAIPVAVVLIPTYLYATSLAGTLVERGGPGWLNLLVLLFFWNATKFAAIGAWAPIQLVVTACSGPKSQLGE